MSLAHVNAPAPLLQELVPCWPEAVSPAAVTVEMRKRVAKVDPVFARVLEGIPEQEPWLGGGVGRVQFYLDIRNHILLKWALSQVRAYTLPYPDARMLNFVFLWRWQ